MASPDELTEADHRFLDLAIQRRDGLEGSRLDLLATVSKLRSGSMTTAIVVILAVVLLQRFIYVSTIERTILTALPAAVVVGAAILDLLHYRPKLSNLEARVDALDEEIRERGGDVLGGPEQDRRREMGTVAVTLFYVVPGLVLLALILWWSL